MRLRGNFEHCGVLVGSSANPLETSENPECKLHSGFFVLAVSHAVSQNSKNIFSGSIKKEHFFIKCSFFVVHSASV
jgi:hypothetical protein